jgi:hypothetical protein
MCNGQKPTYKSALEAKSYAQWIAFSPFVFQATVVMRDSGMLAAIRDAGALGIEASALSETTGISRYAVKVLLDFAGSIELVWQREGRYILAKTGYFILDDEMTRVNMDFTRDICYQALGYLGDSIREGKPKGLNAFGQWNTLYEGLASLPEQVSKSWFRFDHFYSDRVFDEFLPVVFSESCTEILDIGGNTGRWALKCFAYDPNVKVTVMDLPSQLAVARENVVKAGFADRFKEYPIDVLVPHQTFYQGADIIWMSQFLACFSESEILSILRRTVAVMHHGTVLYIIELLWDRQKYEMATFSLNATSLYFTCVANGKSRMYHSDDLKRLVGTAGLIVEQEYDDIGIGHTVFRCKKALQSL